MKTKRIASSLLTLICVFMLGLTACMKDDMPEITNAPDKATSDMNASKVHQPFEMIAIKHIGASLSDKSYSVSMLSNGHVTFVGLANTAILGERSLDIDAATVEQVKNYFSENHFYEMTEPRIVNDLSTVSIGYRTEMNTKLFINASNDTPKYPLFIFARQVESMLGVNSWVNPTDRRELMNDYKL